MSCISTEIHTRYVVEQSLLLSAVTVSQSFTDSLKRLCDNSAVRGLPTGSSRLEVQLHWRLCHQRRTTVRVHRNKFQISTATKTRACDVHRLLRWHIPNRVTAYGQELSQRISKSLRSDRWLNLSSYCRPPEVRYNQSWSTQICIHMLTGCGQKIVPLRLFLQFSQQSLGISKRNFTDIFSITICTYQPYQHTGFKCFSINNNNRYY